MKGLRVRPAGASDLDRVAALEQAIFPHPWSRSMLAEEVRPDPRRIPLLAEIDGRPVGFAFAWRIADEVHLVNIGVLPTEQGAGVGQALLDAVLDHERAADARLATLEVREGNEAARRFYHRNGFCDVALRRGYYPDTGEDAVVMLKILDAGEESP